MCGKLFYRHLEVGVRPVQTLGTCRGAGGAVGGIGQPVWLDGSSQALCVGEAQTKAADSAAQEG